MRLCYLFLNFRGVFTRSGLSLLCLLEELPVVKLPILETLNEVGRGRNTSFFKVRKKMKYLKSWSDAFVIF